MVRIGAENSDARADSPTLVPRWTATYHIRLVLKNGATAIAVSAERDTDVLEHAQLLLRTVEEFTRAEVYRDFGRHHIMTIQRTLAD